MLKYIQLSLPGYQHCEHSVCMPIFLFSISVWCKGMVARLPCTSDFLRWPSYAVSYFSLIEPREIVWSDLHHPWLSDVEHSIFLRFVLGIGSVLTYLLFFQECATPPHVQVHHTTWLTFTRPSPPVLVLQVTNAGVRRPGYEATMHAGLCMAIDLAFAHSTQTTLIQTSSWQYFWATLTIDCT